MNVPKYIFSRWVEVCHGRCPLCREQITEDLVGRETASRSISIPTKEAKVFNCGKCRSREDLQSG
jgi:hypothetical protein